MKTILLSAAFLLLIIISSLNGNAQGEFNNWYFGNNAGVTFNFGTPQYLTNGHLGIPRTSVSVSDSSGNLWFYSDGEKIINRNQVVMPNGDNLLSNYSCDQNVGAIRKMDDDSSYYLFTTDLALPPPQSQNGLHYSVINMRLNGGLGDVEPGMKNIAVQTPMDCPTQLTTARHQNNKDAWVVVRNARNANNYAAYLVTAAGINMTPVLSPTSFQWNTIPVCNFGTMRISFDGKKLVYPYDDTLEICNFNSLTGQVTPLFMIRTGPVFSGNWGYLEFSRDSRYLYCSGGDWSYSPSDIYQYDMSSKDSAAFKQSETLIGHLNRGVHLQLAPDNKIYGTETGTDSLCVINSPETGGVGCNFQPHAVYLGGKISSQGMPVYLERYYIYIRDTGSCTNAPVHFYTWTWPPPDSVSWDFGDLASGGNNFSNLVNSTHTYSTPGTYIVHLYVRHNDKRVDTASRLITIQPGITVNIGPDRVTCEGDSVLLDAGACNGCTYVWDNLTTNQMNIASTQTYWAKASGDYRVTVSNPAFCSGMDTVNVYVNLKPVITTTPLSKNICSGDFTNIVLTSSQPATTFSWTAIPLTGGVTGWFASGTGSTINQQLVNWLTTPGIIDYQIVPVHGSCIGTPVDYLVTVDHGDSVKVSISASANPVCAGTTVTFTANPTNPGTTPAYLWKVNGANNGTNSPAFNYMPLNNDVVTCVLTSSLTTCLSNNPSTSNSITVTVNPNLPVSITIVPNANPVCAGSTATFTAIPVNGGTTPAFQWEVNGVNEGTNSPVFSYIPVNGDLVSCTLTSSELCATNSPASSIQHLVTVSPNLPVSITISASANPFCLGSSVTFTAVAVNGGATPSYQWKVNGINSGTNSNYTYNPANGDVVNCVLTSSDLCTSGNPASGIAMTMIQNSSLPAGITITASANPFCPGSPVTFTASPVNGGTTPSYLWKVNGNNVGTNSPTYSYTPANNDSVRCIMSSNLACVTGSPASSAKIFMSGTLAPAVFFTSCFDTITRINAKPIKLKGGIPLGGTYSGPGVNSITSVFTPALAGAGTHTITYSYTNAALCTASKSIFIHNLPSSLLLCGTSLTDPRDNKVYLTVQIGSQCWFAEDLNYGTEIPSTQDQRDNCIFEKYKNPFSTLHPPSSVYQWDELMSYDDTPADQGLCPPGWHIPGENDWNILFTNFTNSGFAGSPLKYTGYSGFSALLSGARNIAKGWDFQNFAVFFWSSTPSGSFRAVAHGMNQPDPSVSLYPALRTNAYSVRCLKD